LRLLLVLAGIVAGLVVAEVAHRVILRARGRPHDAHAARLAFERRASAALEDLRLAVDGPPPDDRLEGGSELQRRFLHPYTGWEQRGALLQLAQLADQGPSPPNDFQIWVLGGSVAEMFSAMGTGTLIRTLQADPRLAGRKVRVQSLARGGWKMPQPLYAAQFFFALGHRPDAIVAIDGFNEVAVALENLRRGTHPLYPSIPHWGALAAGGSLDVESARILTRALDAQARARGWARRAADCGFAHSSLLTAFAAARIQLALGELARAQDEYARRLPERVWPRVLVGPPFPPEDRAAIEVAVRGWVESARDLQAVCDERGIVCLHALQPTLHDPGAKRATAQELQVGAIGETWRIAVEIGYPLLREAGARMEAEGVAFADASRIFADVEETLYIDACHFDWEGQKILGAWLGERLLERMPR
jgi:hypothetical protein